MADLREEAPGWDAIDGALRPLYGSTEPKHYGTALSQREGGEDPIHGISVYLRDEPSPHFHFVTYGFTELWDKESEDAETSGFGFELTFRLAREEDEEEPPAWVMHFLQNLGRYVFRTGNAFAPGHKMGLNGPIALGERTAITAICFAPDPELGAFHSSNGQAEFLQIVGITDDEYRLIQDWCTDGFLELLAMRSPMLITELWRASLLDRPGVAELLQERIEREGSSETSSFAGDLSYDSDGSRVVLSLGALYAPAIRRAMLGRIRHRRSYQLLGKTQAVIFEPGEAAWSISDGNLVLGVPPGAAKALAAQVGLRAGRYDLSIPGVTLVVAPTYIRDQSGRVIDVKGVDADEIEELAAAENTRLAALAAAAEAEASDAEPVDDEEEDVDELASDDDSILLVEDEDPTKTTSIEKTAKHRPAKPSSKKPAKASPKPRPAAKSSSKKPAAKPSSKKPAAKSSSKKLAAKPSSKKLAAAAKPSSKKPAAKSSSKKPAAKSSSKKPAAAAKSSSKKPAAAAKPSPKKPAAAAKSSSKNAAAAKASPSKPAAKSKPTKAARR